MKPQRGQSNPNQPKLSRSSSGQVVVEYVLLLVVAVALAALIVGLMVSRNPDEPGLIISKWYKIIQTIGSDTADGLPDQE